MLRGHGAANVLARTAGIFQHEAQRLAHGPQKNADFANEMFNDEYAKTKAARLLRSYEAGGWVRSFNALDNVSFTHTFKLLPFLRASMVIFLCSSGSTRTTNFPE